MSYIDSKDINSNNNKDKYDNFGKWKPIPGLKHENLFYRKEAEGSTMHLFTGGIYDGKDGVNGGFVGLKGDIPLYDRGKLEVYGGAGNIAAAGAKFSHSIWQNDNFAFKGYAKAEGTVDLFGKREFAIENTANGSKSETHKDSVLAEGEGTVNTINSYNDEEIIPGIPIQHNDVNNYIDNNILGIDYNKIYHKTYFNNNYNITMSSTDALKGTIFNATAKAAIGMEAEYTNDKGNFSISVGGEIGRKGQFDAVSKMYGIDNDNVNQKIELESSHYNDGAAYDGIHTSYFLFHLANNELGLSNLESQETVNIHNKVQAAGFQTDLNFTSKWYSALKCSANYKIGRLGLDVGTGVDYCDNKFNPTVKAGVSYLIGDKPIIHNHGARVLFAKNTLNKYEGIYEDYNAMKNYPEAKLNVFAKGQAMDGVNGGAIGLEGNIPLNNVGTAMNISAGIGNIITADFNISQTNPTKWNNISLSGRLGVSENISLTEKLALQTEEKIGEQNFTHNVQYSDSIITQMYNDFYNEAINYGMTPEMANAEWENIWNTSFNNHYDYIIDDYTVNEQYELYSTSKCVLPANSTKMYADLSAIYQKNNLKVAIGVEGGYKSAYVNPKTSGEISNVNISSEYVNKLNQDDINISNGGLFNLATNITNIEESTTAHYFSDTSYVYDKPLRSALIRQPGGDCSHAGAYVFSGIEGNTNINMNASSDGEVSFVPKFMPYLTATCGIEYDIKDAGTVGVKASLGGLTGVSVILKR